MSHYTTHQTLPANIPKPRIIFMSVSLVAVGLLGFYSSLKGRHDRKVVASSKGAPSLSSWESRLLARGQAPNPALGAAHPAGSGGPAATRLPRPASALGSSDAT